MNKYFFQTIKSLLSFAISKLQILFSKQETLKQ